jgi:acyl-CoA reductase-like NAD-dependent aldehyde dehydrogenase
MRDETFGPIVGIMKVSSDEEAIALMNDSEFGLTGSIWTRNLDGKAEDLADQVEAGTVFINRYSRVKFGVDLVDLIILIRRLRGRG